MKMKLKLQLISILLVIIACTAYSQESNDYYKFDDNGKLIEFQLTIPDGVQIKYVGERGEGIMIYPDGTKIDFSESVSDSFGTLYVQTDGKTYDTNIPLKDWYKDLRKATSAPSGQELVNSCFGLSEVTIIFKDNSQVLFRYRYDYIENSIDISESGDLLSIDPSGIIDKLSLNNPNLYDPATDKFVPARLASGEKGEYVYCPWADSKVPEIIKTFRYCHGLVITENGDTFTGNYCVFIGGDKWGYSPRSPYLKTLWRGELEKEKMTFPAYGLDNIVGICLGDGIMVNKNDKIVAIYKNTEQLDEFDMASELAAAQGAIDREREAARKAANEREAITTKYGKKYADAFFSGEILVGMPWSLVEIGLNAHTFKDFYMAMISIDHRSSGARAICYTLIGHNLAYVGQMWVVNDKVESITYY